MCLFREAKKMYGLSSVDDAVIIYIKEVKLRFLSWFFSFNHELIDGSIHWAELLEASLEGKPNVQVAFVTEENNLSPPTADFF